MDEGAIVPLQTLPAVFADKRHKPHRSDFNLLELITVTREHVQCLFFPIAERNKNTASLGQLLLIRRWHFGGAGTDEYRVVRRVLPPTQSAIAHEKGDIARTNLLNRLTRLIEQRRNSFYRENLPRQKREQRRLITGSRSYRQRRIFVSAVPNTGGHEQMARRLVYRVEDSEVLDALLMQQLDESPPRSAELVL